ncbi:MAG: hypothetical protein Q7S14_02845 [bacterium]|nr:hypothetical protein [bacterium]
MLTKNDLIAIGNLFDQKFDEKFDQKFDEKFDEKLGPNFHDRFVQVEKRLKRNTRAINRVDKDMKLLTATLDIDVSRERKRVNKVEEYLQNYAVPRFVAYADPPSN